MEKRIAEGHGQYEERLAAHERLHKERHRHIEELNRQIAAHKNDLGLHMERMELMMSEEQDNREMLGRRLTDSQNQISLEQLERVDKMLSSEKRLCTKMVLQQARDQTESFLADSLRKIRNELGADALASPRLSRGGVSSGRGGAEMSTVRDLVDTEKQSTLRQLDAVKFNLEVHA